MSKKYLLKNNLEFHLVRNSAIIYLVFWNKFDWKLKDSKSWYDMLNSVDWHEFECIFVESMTLNDLFNNICKKLVLVFFIKIMPESQNICTRIKLSSINFAEFCKNKLKLVVRKN